MSWWCTLCTWLNRTLPVEWHSHLWVENGMSSLWTNNKSSCSSRCCCCFSAYKIGGGHILPLCEYVWCVCVSVQSEHVVRHVKWSILSMNAWLCDVADADAHFASVFAIYLKVLMLFSFLESTCRTVCLHHEPLPKISHIPAVTHFVATFSTAIWFRLCYKFGFSPPCSCIHIKMLFCFYHFNSSRNCCFVFEMLIHVCTLNFSCC